MCAGDLSVTAVMQYANTFLFGTQPLRGFFSEQILRKQNFFLFPRLFFCEAIFASLFKRLKEKAQLQPSALAAKLRRETFASVYALLGTGPLKGVYTAYVPRLKMGQ